MPNYIADLNNQDWDMINIGGLQLGGSASNPNGTKYDPSVLTISMQDVHSPNSGRDQSGTMRFKVVARKMKIELEWWYPTPEVVKKILQSIKYEYDPALKQDVIYVAIHTPSNDTTTEYKMYRGDRTMPYQIWAYGNRRFKSLKFSLIEV